MSKLNKYKRLSSSHPKTKTLEINLIHPKTKTQVLIITALLKVKIKCLWISQWQQQDCICVYCRYGDGYILIGFSKGFLISISTHMKEIGQVAVTVLKLALVLKYIQFYD